MAKPRGLTRKNKASLNANKTYEARPFLGRPTVPAVPFLGVLQCPRRLYLVIPSGPAATSLCYEVFQPRHLPCLLGLQDSEPVRHHLAPRHEVWGCSWTFPWSVFNPLPTFSDLSGLHTPLQAKLTKI